ncbi:MAG: hypothetical protein RLO52_31655 [Sandaracinaceae bacterium]
MHERIIKGLKSKDEARFEDALGSLSGAGAEAWDAVLAGVTWARSKYEDRGEPGELSFGAPLKPRGASAERTRARILRLLHLAPADADVVARVRDRATSLLVRSTELPIDLAWLSNWPSLRQVDVRGGASVHGAAAGLEKLRVERLLTEEAQLAAMKSLELLAVSRVEPDLSVTRVAPSLRELRVMAAEADALSGVEAATAPSLWLRGRFPERLRIHQAVEDLHVLDCRGLRSLVLPDGAAMRRIRQWYASEPTALSAGELPALRELHLTPFDHEDLTPLAGATALTVLRVGGAKLRSLSGLPRPEQLEELSVADANIAWDALAEARSLHTFSAGTSNWWDAVPILESLPDLRTVRLDGANVEDTHALRNLHQVTNLSMVGCTGFLQVDWLGHLSSLETLDLSRTGMTRRDLPSSLRARGVRVTL